jgi:hypothetical protein
MAWCRPAGGSYKGELVGFRRAHVVPQASDLLKKQA